MDASNQTQMNQTLLPVVAEEEEEEEPLVLRKRQQEVEVEEEEASTRTLPRVFLEPAVHACLAL